jgi:hypothetical protein
LLQRNLDLNAVESFQTDLSIHHSNESAQHGAPIRRVGPCPGLYQICCGLHGFHRRDDEVAVGLAEPLEWNPDERPVVLHQTDLFRFDFHESGACTEVPRCVGPHPRFCRVRCGLRGFQNRLHKLPIFLAELR